MSTGEHNPLLKHSSEERGAFHTLAMYPPFWVSEKE